MKPGANMYRTYSKLPLTGTLLAAASLLPVPAAADFQPLNDSAMSSVTGQAGATIDLETRLTFDSWTWPAGAPLVVNGIWLSGTTDPVSDNLNLTANIAGEGELRTHGFSEIARRADAGLLDS